MKSKDWYLRVMVTLLVVGVWVLILKPVLAPTPGHAAEAEKVVRAQKFELVDGEGKVRAALAPFPDGSPALALLDGRGKMRAWFRVEPDGSPHLGLSGGQDKGGASLSVLRDAGPALILTDGQRKVRAALRLVADGGPGLHLWDARGKRRAALGATLGVTDVELTQVGIREGKITLTGSVEKRPESSLVLFDKEGKVLWQAP